MTQFYVIEIQTYQDGSFGDIKHIAYDEDPGIARLKGEAKWHEIMAAAAVSTLPCHAVTLLTTDGRCIMNGCYRHTVTPEPEPTPETEEPTE